MNTIKIKICGIRTPEMAKFCGHAGADYIGLVFSEQSSRHVTLSQAKKIAEAARGAGTMPVAVCVDQDAQEILHILDETGITIVQLHGDRSRATLPLLLDDIQIILAMPSLAYHPNYMTDLRKDCDYILLDAEKPGSGKTSDWTSFYVPEDLPFFLAGGLHINNIAEAIQTVHPDAVDVSTGVESSPGIKNEALIFAFIQAVNEVCHA